MKKLNGYLAGVNLGHWISQYPKDAGKEYWSDYIQEKDFKRIKDWGCDHIRLPVDYPVFYNADSGEFLEQGLFYVDFAVEMCKKYGLNMVLDLHHAPGYAFWNKYDKEKNSLFTNPAQQKVLINIWQMFAHRYKNEHDNLVFEILNEMVLEDSGPWNELWPKVAEAVWAVAPYRRVVIGSNRWNSVEELKNLTFINDDRIIYNFHCYSPFIFTHQRAKWEPVVLQYQHSVTYPFNTKEHTEYFELVKDTWLPQNFERVDKSALREFLKDAKDFIDKHDVPLYCGEFGVIENADDESAIRWLNDMVDIFNEYSIGHAVWSYRGFARITDKNNNVVDQRFIDAITKTDKRL